MVEAQLEGVPEAETPSGGYFSAQHFRRRTEPHSESPVLNTENSDFHDRSDLATPTVPSESSQSGRDITRNSMQGGDARGGMPESSRPGSHRRRSRPTVANPSQQRPPGQHPFQPQTGHGYAGSSSSPSENIHSHPPTAFQGSPIHYPPATASYTQRPGYVGQYTMSAQPGPMSMAHSPPPYAFPHAYPHQVVPDNSMLSQNIHPSYQAMLQPHTPVFPYQGESSSSPHHSFSGTSSSPMYASHQYGSSSPTSPHLPPSAGQSSALPSYVTPGAFHSLPYPSTMATTPYMYPTQTYPPSPMYQSPQFAPSPFGQHYTPAQEGEPQGSWYYLLHPPAVHSPQPYDAGTPYETHYAVEYRQGGHSSAGGSYGGPDQASSSNPPTSSSNYAIPSPSLRSQHSDTPGSPQALGSRQSFLHSTHPSIPAPLSASSGSGRQATSDRPIMRRSWHPNPPAHRSEWVMWAGNVPADATHDELWRFFNQGLLNQPQSQPPPQPQPAEDGQATGVLSIFLISRSNCAFVNFLSDALLHRAIALFDGVPLRANDPRCPRLVCRVRAQDDDLKAGVGGQRGMGMHTKWIKDQKGKTRAEDDGIADALEPSSSSSSTSDDLKRAMSGMSLSSDEEGMKSGLHAKHSSSSGSYVSTNSSFLVKYFPKRYFILKSLTQEDLDTSVREGVWATQKHNEEILDQAFRTSQEVNLIFSVNKSREFYGYARMTGHVRHGEQSIPWASRQSQAALPTPRSADQRPAKSFLSPNDPGRQVDGSPLSIGDMGMAGAQTMSSMSRNPSHGAQHQGVAHSAPGVLGEKYHLPTLKTPTVKHSLDQRRYPGMMQPSPDGFPLDPNAPMRAMRVNQGGSGSSGSSGSAPAGVDGQERAASSKAPALRVVEEEAEGKTEEEEAAAEDAGAGSPRPRVEVPGEEESWGDSFAVEWLCTDRLAFHRTRHLRNPWNHDKEVKVSRDGTELEPTVGQQLLDEWQHLAAESQAPPPALPPVGAGRPSSGKRVAVARPANLSTMSERDAEGSGGSREERGGRKVT